MSPGAELGGSGPGYAMVAMVFSSESKKAQRVPGLRCEGERQVMRSWGARRGVPTVRTDRVEVRQDRFHNWRLEAGASEVAPGSGETGRVAGFKPRHGLSGQDIQGDSVRHVVAPHVGHEALEGVCELFGAGELRATPIGPFPCEGGH